MQAILDETRETYRSCRDICFDGNGYSDEWKKEAKRRGLDCETSTPVVYDHLFSPETIKLYGDMGVMSESELKARQETAWEMYSKKIDIEANILSDLTMNHVLPVATRYQSILLDNVAKMKEIFNGKDFDSVAAGEIENIKEIALHMSDSRRLVAEMEEACAKALAAPDERKKAVIFHDKVTKYLDEIRVHVDALEMIVDDEMWPLPKYRELLFIR